MPAASDLMIKKALLGVFSCALFLVVLEVHEGWELNGSPLPSGDFRSIWSRLAPSGVFCSRMAWVRWRKETQGPFQCLSSAPSSASQFVEEEKIVPRTGAFGSGPTSVWS